MSEDKRITVALIKKVAAELRQIQDRTGLSQTDAVNRAITAYDFLEQQQAAGHELVLRRRDSGSELIVRFL